MMRPGRSKIAAYLIDGELALKNARDLPEIFALIQPHGYTRERLDAGWELYKESYRLFREQEFRYTDQYEAGELLRRLRKQGTGGYAAMRNLARVALSGETALLKALGLNEKPGRSLNAWLGHARQFVHNALADAAIWQKLDAVGVTREKLRELRDLTKRVETAAETHEAAKGRAIKATKERDEAFGVFRRWMYDFRQVTCVALAGSPQFLEKLKIKA